MAEAAKSPTAEDVVRDVRAGRVAPVYYLMGEEDYYINELGEFLTNTLLKPEERDFNLDIVYGADTTIAQVVELAQAYPMMADRRVVVVREAQALRSLDALEDYLKQPNPTTVLVFCHKHGKLDGRKIQFAYNLDGGNSTTVIFHNQKINATDKERGRDLSDIIYFATAWEE